MTTMEKKIKRKIIKEEIVESFFSGRESTPWYKKWFLYKPRWWWTELSFWFRSKKEFLMTGFPHVEAWNFNTYHSKWSVPRLKHLRDNGHGHPANIEIDNKVSKFGSASHVIGMPDTALKSQKKEFSRKVLAWKAVLDKMIWSFEHLEDFVKPIYPKDYDERMKKTFYDDESVSYVHIDKRKPDYSPINEHNKKVQEGLDLFAKHYQDLWN